MKTLKEHLELAQFHFRKKGEIVPNLTVEDADGKKILFVFAMVKEGAQQEAMNRAGHEACHVGVLGEVKKIIFTSEAWVKSFPKDADISEIKSIAKDPDKKEVLLVSSLDADGKFEIEMSYIIRRGKYIDFSKPEKTKDEDAFGDLRILKKFWEGYLEAKNEHK